MDSSNKEPPRKQRKKYNTKILFLYPEYQEDWTCVKMHET